MDIKLAQRSLAWSSNAGVNGFSLIFFFRLLQRVAVNTFSFLFLTRRAPLTQIPASAPARVLRGL